MDTRARVLIAIESHWAENGYAPTLRDIQEAANISSTSVVSYHLKRLEAMGKIKPRPYYKARTIRLANSDEKKLSN